MNQNAKSETQSSPLVPLGQEEPDTNKIINQASEMVHEEMPETLTAGEFVTNVLAQITESFLNNCTNFEVVVTIN